MLLTHASQESYGLYKEVNFTLAVRNRYTAQLGRKRSVLSNVRIHIVYNGCVHTRSLIWQWVHACTGVWWQWGTGCPPPRQMCWFLQLVCWVTIVSLKEAWNHFIKLRNFTNAGLPIKTLWLLILYAGISYVIQSLSKKSTEWCSTAQLSRKRSVFSNVLVHWHTCMSLFIMGRVHTHSLIWQWVHACTGVWWQWGTGCPPPRQMCWFLQLVCWVTIVSLKEAWNHSIKLRNFTNAGLPIKTLWLLILYAGISYVIQSLSKKSTEWCSTAQLSRKRSVFSNVLVHWHTCMSLFIMGCVHTHSLIGQWFHACTGVWWQWGTGCPPPRQMCWFLQLVCWVTIVSLKEAWNHSIKLRNFTNAGLPIKTLWLLILYAGISYVIQSLSKKSTEWCSTAQLSRKRSVFSNVLVHWHTCMSLFIMGCVHTHSLIWQWFHACTGVWWQWGTGCPPPRQMCWFLQLVCWVTIVSLKEAWNN